MEQTLRYENHFPSLYCLNFDKLICRKDWYRGLVLDPRSALISIFIKIDTIAPEKTYSLSFRGDTFDHFKSSYKEQGLRWTEHALNHKTSTVVISHADSNFLDLIFNELQLYIVTKENIDKCIEDACSIPDTNLSSPVVDNYYTISFDKIFEIITNFKSNLKSNEKIGKLSEIELKDLNSGFYCCSVCDDQKSWDICQKALRQMYVNSNLISVVTKEYEPHEINSFTV